MSIQLVKANRFVLNRRADTYWPDKFNTDQIADLLTWRDGIQDAEWKREAEMWRDALWLACESVDLPFNIETKKVCIQEFKVDFIDGRGPYTTPEKYADVTFINVTAPDLARWLAEQDQSPGELLKAWFKSQGVGRTAVEVIPPAPAAPPEAVVMPSPAVPAVAESWHIKKPERAHGYTWELYSVLKDAHDAGKPRPKARDVLDSWAECKPIDILEVTRVAFKCKNSNGSVKSVSIDSLRTAIDRMTTPDNAR